MSPLGPQAIDGLILDSALQANVLPLGSQCDSRCVFCSHKNNPPGIAVAFAGRRTMAEVTRALAFLNPERVITIGESATAIVEGEPLLHPDFAEIVMLVRRVFPATPIEITTNGRLLDEKTVALLEAAGGVTLNVSLNSASARGRSLLMGDSPEQSKRALAGLGLLGRSSVPFSGSLVAMPNLVGWDDLRETVGLLQAVGAKAVRVIVPAFADGADRGMFPDETTIFGEVRAFVAAMSVEASCPVLMEPSWVADLTPVASGVVGGSPAWVAGVRAGDVFEEIGRARPFCRVQAWRLLSLQGEVRARIDRAGEHLEIAWVNESCDGSGVTMEYDFDPERAERVRQIVNAGCDGTSLLLVSELGHGVVRAVLERQGLGDDVATALAVKNLTFGGTIRASGLLTVEDYLAAYGTWRDSHGARASRLLVPVESFDPHGRDLKGRHFLALEDATGVPVVVA